MSARLRVAHVSLQLETGGMERLLAEFARHADRARFSLHFVALTSKGRVAEDLEACGWPVTALDARPGVRPSTLYKLAKLFQQEQIDIVHTHNTKPLLYAGPAARLAGVRGVVHTRHGQRQGASPRQDMMFRLAARCADRLVCVSEDSQRLCSGDGIGSEALCTIWNGIDRERFALAGPHAEGPAVYVGRLSPEKDVATLLRATALVVRQLPSFRLQIAGGGSCSSELATLAQQFQITGNVEFLGEVRDITSIYRGASLFVLPSLTEGLPLTVLEAMSCGLPVVATKVGGTPEAVEDETTGLLVPAADPARLASALLRLSTNPSWAAQMGLAGHRRVERFFDVRSMVARYQLLYHEILGARKARAA